MQIVGALFIEEGASGTREFQYVTETNGKNDSFVEIYQHQRNISFSDKREIVNLFVNQMEKSEIIIDINYY